MKTFEERAGEITESAFIKYELTTFACDELNNAIAQTLQEVYNEREAYIETLIERIEDLETYKRNN